jgi:hypothetical protein
MTETRPQMGPGGVLALSEGAGRYSMPMATPPATLQSVTAKEGCGCNGNGAETASSVAELPAPAMAGMGDMAPSVRPVEGVSAGITAWQNNKRVTGLWSINQDKNAWVHVDGIGWKKLANNSASAIIALTLLGTHAREKAAVVNYREESDGLIHEIYVW